MVSAFRLWGNVYGRSLHDKNAKEVLTVEGRRFPWVARVPDGERQRFFTILEYVKMEAPRDRQTAESDQDAW